MLQLTPWLPLLWTGESVLIDFRPQPVFGDNPSAKHSGERRVPLPTSRLAARSSQLDERFVILAVDRLFLLSGELFIWPPDSVRATLAALALRSRGQVSSIWPTALAIISRANKNDATIWPPEINRFGGTCARKPQQDAKGWRVSRCEPRPRRGRCSTLCDRCRHTRARGCPQDGNRHLHGVGREKMRERGRATPPSDRAKVRPPRAGSFRMEP